MYTRPAELADEGDRRASWPPVGASRSTRSSTCRSGSGATTGGRRAAASGGSSPSTTSTRSAGRPTRPGTRATPGSRRRSPPSRALRDHGLEFVVAPEPTGDGRGPAPARPVRARAVPARRGADAPVRPVPVGGGPSGRARPGRPAPRRARRRPAWADDFVLRNREDLDRALDDLDGRWDTGPYGEPCREVLVEQRGRAAPPPRGVRRAGRPGPRAPRAHGADPRRTARGQHDPDPGRLGARRLGHRPGRTAGAGHLGDGRRRPRRARPLHRGDGPDGAAGGHRAVPARVGPRRGGDLHRPPARRPTSGPRTSTSRGGTSRATSSSCSSE